MAAMGRLSGGGHPTACRPGLPRAVNASALEINAQIEPRKRVPADVSNRGSIALGELQGKLDLLEIKCHRCERHGRRAGSPRRQNPKGKPPFPPAFASLLADPDLPDFRAQTLSFGFSAARPSLTLLLRSRTTARGCN